MAMTMSSTNVSVMGSPKHDILLLPEDAAIPTEFLCALTHRLMENPLRDDFTGKNYDRQAVFDYMFFGGSDSSYATTSRRSPLHPSHLRPNLVLQSRIEKWKMTTRRSQGQSQGLSRETGSAGSVAGDSRFEQIPANTKLSLPSPEEKWWSHVAAPLAKLLQ